MALLESCVDTLEKAIDAYYSGANRLELCSELALDGLSPSLELIESTARAVPLPIHVMIRLKNIEEKSVGYRYTTEDVVSMCEFVRSVDALRLPNVVGFVFGCLTETNELDEVNTAKLVECIHFYDTCYSITFHRAFDRIADKVGAIEKLQRLHVTRILTSGTPADQATNNLNMLEKLVATALEHDIILMPCGGVREHNAQDILSKTRAVEIHSSAAWKLFIAPS